MVANSAALDVLRDELPNVILWVEFRPGKPGRGGQPASPVVQDRRPRTAPDDFTPVMARPGPADLAPLDGLITAGIPAAVFFLPGDVSGGFPLRVDGIGGDDRLLGLWCS